MSAKETTLIAVGGGDIASATAVLDAIFKTVEHHMGAGFEAFRFQFLSAGSARVLRDARIL